jgi:ATP synthase protein I
MNEKNEKGKDFVRLTRLSSIGIAMILCTFIGYAVGLYLDKWVHSAPVFTIIFLLLGVAAGFLNAFRTIIKDTD